MVYVDQPMTEFLEQLRAWAINKNATPAFIDKIDELINEYNGTAEERIEAAKEEARADAARENEVAAADMQRENEKLTERIAELETELTKATRHKMPWES